MVIGAGRYPDIWSYKKLECGGRLSRFQCSVSTVNTYYNDRPCILLRYDDVSPLEVYPSKNACRQTALATGVN